MQLVFTRLNQLFWYLIVFYVYQVEFMLFGNEFKWYLKPYAHTKYTHKYVSIYNV